MTSPALLTVAVVWLCVANFRSEAWSRNIGLAAFQRPAQMTEAHQELDDLFGRKMQSGNIWVRFEGFRPEKAADEIFMTRVYYRGNYSIYPRRIYVSHPSTVINNGKAMVQHDAFLTRPLAKKLGIYWKVVYSRNGLGQISVRIQRLQ
jgi:hypothetical protein